ncbi:MAG: sugar phosphate isomerase/epimerase family protein [Nitrososphaerales archaeon]
MLGLSSMYTALFDKTIESFIDDVKANLDLNVAEVFDFRTTMLTEQTASFLKDVNDVKFTVHGPFDVASKISDPSDDSRKLAVAKLKSSIDFAADIEALAFVQHPGNKTFSSDSDLWQLNCQSLVEIIDYGNSRGMKVGIENMTPDKAFMSSPPEFEEFSKANNIDLNLVFDTGHANIAKKIDEFVEKYSSKFLIIHATDNDGDKDLHLNIGEGNIDWTKLVQSLRNFTGVYVIESVWEPLKSLTKLKALLG